MTRNCRTLAIAPIVCLLISGCHVSEHKNGSNDNVDIGTPFGSMHVKTNDTNTTAIGIAVYPGAFPAKEDGDKNSGSANINMNFGSFHLGVKAASFQTPDSEEKVLAFYRKELSARYGDVITCQGSRAVSSPAHTSQGLTCNDDGNHMHTGLGPRQTGIHFKDSVSDHDNLELRTGSAHHQHIVSVEAHDGGTKIGLVSLDLPSDTSDHDSKDSE